MPIEVIRVRVPAAPIIKSQRIINPITPIAIKNLCLLLFQVYTHVKIGKHTAKTTAVVLVLVDVDLGLAFVTVGLFSATNCLT